MNLLSGVQTFNLFWQKVQTIEGQTQDLNITSLEVDQDNHSNGKKSAIFDSPDCRIKVTVAYDEVLEKVSKKWLGKAKNILEVGCGRLNKAGRSFTTMSISDDIASKFVYSDLNRAVDAFRNPKFFAGNVTQLSTVFKKRKFDVVMSSCALDTVGTSRMTPALKEIGKVLEKNGLLICLSDQIPFFDTLTDYYVKNNMIIFPYIVEEGYIKGLQVISPENLEIFLKKTKLTPEERDFIVWYKNLEVCKREKIFIYLIVKNFKHAAFLSKWTFLQKMEGAEIVLNEKFYHDNLRKGLGEAGFKIKVFKDMDESTIIKANAVNNYIFFDRGHDCSRRIHVLAPGHVYCRVRLHLVVAQKVE